MHVAVVGHFYLLFVDDNVTIDQCIIEEKKLREGKMRGEGGREK